MALPAPTPHPSYPMDIAIPPGYARAGQYQSMSPFTPMGFNCPYIRMKSLPKQADLQRLLNTHVRHRLRPFRSTMGLMHSDPATRGKIAPSHSHHYAIFRLAVAQIRDSS